MANKMEDKDVGDFQNPALFYAQNGGQKLIDEENYPPEIQEFLIEEAKQISSHLRVGKYTTLFEIGCMEARNLDLALNSKVSYCGIDIVESSIIKAQKIIEGRKIGEFAKLLFLSAIDLTPETTPLSPSEKPLCVFPFNSFGNMQKVTTILHNLFQLNYDFLISTYKTDKITNQIRQAYYENCGYQNIQCRNTEEGITFTADEGLHTTAYHIDTLNQYCQHPQYKVAITPFSKIGILILGTHTPK